MEVQFPARDTANDNFKKINSNLKEVLDSCASLKDFLTKSQKFEEVAIIRNIEIKMEDSLKQMNKLIL